MNSIADKELIRKISEYVMLGEELVGISNGNNHLRVLHIPIRALFSILDEYKANTKIDTSFEAMNLLFDEIVKNFDNDNIRKELKYILDKTKLKSKTLIQAENNIINNDSTFNN